MTIFSARSSTFPFIDEKKCAMIGVFCISLHISICTYRSLGTNCVAHCRWTDRMNGYDAIMQGRHGLRNMIQPSNTEYYRCIRLEETTSEKERGGKRLKERERERETRGKEIWVISPTRIEICWSVARIFCGYPYRSMCETFSRCTPRAMKNTRFL